MLILVELELIQLKVGGCRICYSIDIYLNYWIASLWERVVAALEKKRATVWM